jgi:hypothetical protein
VTTPPTEVGGFSGDGPVAVSTPAGPVRARRGPRPLDTVYIITCQTGPDHISGPGVRPGK